MRGFLQVGWPKIPLVSLESSQHTAFNLHAVHDMRVCNTGGTCTLPAWLRLTVSTHACMQQVCMHSRSRIRVVATQVHLQAVEGCNGLEGLACTPTQRHAGKSHAMLCWNTSCHRHWWLSCQHSYVLVLRWFAATCPH
jgi:hypothetical protein